MEVVFFLVFILICVVYLRKRRLDRFESIVDYSNKLAYNTMSDKINIGDISSIMEETLLQSYVNEGASILNKLLSVSPAKFSTDIIDIRKDLYDLEVNGTGLDTLISHLKVEIDNINDQNDSLEELKKRYNNTKK